MTDTNPQFKPKTWTLSDMAKDARACNARMHCANGSLAISNATKERYAGIRAKLVDALPQGRFGIPDAATAWGCHVHTAQHRLATLFNAGILNRTPTSARPVMYWAAGK